MPQPLLSVVVITKNEVARLETCLASVAFADEWIVVDSGSDDGTREIAMRLGARFVTTDDWPGFGAQKQRALDLATGRWVLSIDADEQVTPELAASIRTAIADERSAAGYELARVSRFQGRWIRHGAWYPDRVLRLFRRDAGRFSTDRVHERVIVDGRVARLEGELLHDTMPTLQDALDKSNRYSSASAAERAAQGERGGLAPAMAHATWAFLRSYCFRRGFLDGSAGFVLALYVAEGTFWRYLKIAEHARRLPTER